MIKKTKQKYKKQSKIILEQKVKQIKIKNEKKI